MLPDKKDKLVTIEFFYDFLIANTARNKLRDQKIPSFLEDGNSENSLEEIELKVFLKDLKAAYKILSE
ncbi:MAG: hypothetical protein JWP12_2491 [Bacteroidetes bacterium]|nr:hypothetical protein [Bacteroidota bacterium]